MSSTRGPASSLSLWLVMDRVLILPSVNMQYARQRTYIVDGLCLMRRCFDIPANQTKHIRNVSSACCSYRRRVGSEKPELRTPGNLGPLRCWSG